MAEQTYTPRLKQHYQDVLRGELSKTFGYQNPMQVPRLDKVVLKYRASGTDVSVIGFNEASSDMIDRFAVHDKEIGAAKLAVH